MPVVNLPSPTQGKSKEDTIQNLIDVVFRLRKELDFLLQNLDSQNIDTLTASKIIAGTIDLSNSITISNEDGKVIIDSEGLKIYGKDTESEGITIYNNAEEQVFGLDTNGNIVMVGTIDMVGTLDWGNITGSNKPADNATVGANFSTNLLNIPGTLKAPTVNDTGLFLSNSALGFYKLGNWKTYMDNNGNFYLGGASGKLQWNALLDTLSIQGNVVMEGGSISWANITSPDYSQLEGTKPPTDADNTTNIIGEDRLTEISETGIYTGTIAANLAEIADEILLGSLANNGKVTFRSGATIVGDTRYGGFASIVVSASTFAVVDGHVIIGSTGSDTIINGKVDFSGADSVTGLTAVWG